MIEDKNDITVLVNGTLNNLLRWLEATELRSFDWWDIWGTRYGGWAKTMYFKNRVLGGLMVAPFIILDLFYPAARKWFVKKRAFPICHAHISLGYLNLHQITQDQSYLEKAINLVPELMDMASQKAQSGLGWGMKHQWMTIQGLVPIDTPCNTQTAYPFELFCRLYDLTNDPIYRHYLDKILRHVSNDFNEWWIEDMLVCSYSTIDNRRVINANSYRMYMLLEGGARFDNEEYTRKGVATARYIISSQNPDGSWPYSEDQSFVDCYHTAFVLKNLLRSKEILRKHSIDVDTVIKSGYSYYLENLFDAQRRPKPFAVEPRFTIFEYDSYDLAESIGLLSETSADRVLLHGLIQFAKEKFQTQAGWFRFRLYRFIRLNGIPYMRYANSAMFYSLTKFLKNSPKNDQQD
ncbi:MAG: hypothetical protein KF687_05940 [Cyclobacteriaceae bacterium]|nr:hypothetical protein [Cyclobacteriaceae bacterium]